MSWYETKGCVCGTTEITARISRSVSAYLWGNVPTHEIEQNIGWLEDVKRDCEYKISQLQSLQRERERAQNWRKNINKLARQFYDPDALHLDLETRQQIIQQRLDVPPHIARHLAERVHAWAKRQQRKSRDAAICLKRDAGASVTDLAKEYGISRQQVHNILNKDPSRRFLR